VWSPNSANLAFLWNEHGSPFRDIWVVSASDTAPRRLTDMGKTYPYQDGVDPDPYKALAQSIEARTRGGVSDFAWTPDSAALVFTYRGDLFRTSLDGSGLARLTQGGGAGSSLAFSPDGRFVSFLRGGDLWLFNPATRATIRATHVGVPAIGEVPVGQYHRPDVEVGSYVWAADRPAYVWSPDGKYIAFHYEDRRQMRTVPFPYYLTDETSMNVHRRGYPGDHDEIRAVGFYTVDEGQMRLVDLPDPTLRTIGSVAWSPDSRLLLVDESTDVAEDRWLYAVKRENRAFEEVWHDHGDGRVNLTAVSQWTTDGRGVVFVGDLDDRYRLYSLPLGSRTPKRLTSGTWDVAGARGAGAITVSPRREIFFVSTEKSPYERQVYRMPEDGGAITQITSLPGVHTPIVSPDGSTVALLSSNDVTPTELYLVGAGGGPERRITHSPPPEFYEYHWVQPRYVTFKSRTDNFTLHARILEPPGLVRGKKYPVIFGSTYSNTVRNQWAGLNATLQQYLALERGYIGVLVDVRGSTGYGRAFREKFLMDWGGGDVEDLQSAVDYLKTLPYVDGDRIGIWGSSYGGLLTVFTLFEKPGLFAAGVAGAPALDPSFFGTDDVEITRLPNTHPEAFRRSALQLGEKLRDHLLIIQGMQDDVVPFKTTVMLAERLMKLGKDFDIAIAPTAPHGWSQKEYYAVFMLRKRPALRPLLGARPARCA
jgi:dipeptidyl-peptidase-4